MSNTPFYSRKNTSQLNDICVVYKQWYTQTHTHAALALWFWFIQWNLNQTKEAITTTKAKISKIQTLSCAWYWNCTKFRGRKIFILRKSISKLSFTGWKWSLPNLSHVLVIIVIELLQHTHQNASNQNQLQTRRLCYWISLLLSDDLSCTFCTIAIAIVIARRW